MGRDGIAVQPEAVQGYLRAHVSPEARLLSLTPLGAGVQEDLKSYGYGRPLLVTWEQPSPEGAAERRAVLRTMAPDPYGHDRRADRIAVLTEAFDDFPLIPRHIRPLDLGTFDGDGHLVPNARGEPWLLTEYVDGELYAHELAVHAPLDHAPQAALERAAALARYLAELHAEKRPPEDHIRHVRDTVGSGEGIAGIADGWPHCHPVADEERLALIERAAVRFRWRLKAFAHRSRRIHGDFHPFNILFREGTDFSVLDASRRSAGDPADDVTCMGLNYLFFALRARGRFTGAAREMWDTFWQTYLDTTNDRELLRVVAPWFAWRALVVTSPSWYPEVPNAVRDRILIFVERLLSGAPFNPKEVDVLL